MFAERLKELRNARSLMQKDISRIFNVSMGAVGNWESGKRIPDTDTLVRIADYFGVSVDYLIGHDTPETARRPAISAEDLRLLEAYHANPAAQLYINRILGLPDPSPAKAQDPAEDVVQALLRLQEEKPSSL